MTGKEEETSAQKRERDDGEDSKEAEGGELVLVAKHSDLIRNADPPYSDPYYCTTTVRAASKAAKGFK